MKKMLPIAISAFVGILFISILLFLLSDSEVSEWQQKITDVAVQEKEAANQQLAEYFSQQKRVLPEFFPCFSVRSSLVRKNALRVLGSLESEIIDTDEIRKVLVSSLDDGQPEIRKEAALALLKLKKPNTEMAKSVYTTEKDKEVQCYLSGTIALSLSTLDLVILKDHLTNSADKEYMRTVLKTYESYRLSTWKSLSDDQKMNLVAELAPVVDKINFPELNTVLQKITQQSCQTTTEWYKWITKEQKKSITSLKEKQLRKLFFSDTTSNAKKFAIVKKLGIYPQDMKWCLAHILKKDGQLHYIFSQIKDSEYPQCIDFIRNRYENSRYLIDFLLRKNTTASNDFLIENIDTLLEDEQQILLKQIQTNPNKSNYQVTIYGNGEQVQILKYNNNSFEEDKLEAEAESESQQQTVNESPKSTKNEENLRKEIQELRKKLNTRRISSYNPGNPIELITPEIGGSVGIPTAYDFQVRALADAGDVSVTLILPKTSSFLRSRPRAKVNGRKLTWNYDVLPADTLKKIQVWFVPTTEGKQQLFSFSNAISINSSHALIGKPKIELQFQGPKELNLKEEFFYTLKAKNIGTAIAHELVATFALPEGMVHDSGERRLIFPIGTININEEKSLDIAVRAIKKGEQCCKVLIKGLNIDPVDAITCSEVIVKDLELLVDITKQSFVGEQILANIAVKNVGNVDIENIKLKALFSENTQVTSHDITSAKELPNQISWMEDIIPAEEQVNFSFLLTSKQAGNECLEVNLVCDQIRKNVQHCVTWKGIPKLEVALSGPTIVKVGEECSYSIKIKNIGSATAQNVKLDYLFPVKLQHESNHQQIEVVIEDIPANTVKEIEVKAKAIDAGDVKNIATIHYSNQVVEDCTMTIIEK